MPCELKYELQNICVTYLKDCIIQTVCKSTACRTLVNLEGVGDAIIIYLRQDDLPISFQKLAIWDLVLSSCGSKKSIPNGL